MAWFLRLSGNQFHITGPSITAETMTRHGEKTSAGRANMLSRGDTGYRLAEVDEVLGCLVVQTVEHHEAEPYHPTVVSERVSQRYLKLRSKSSNANWDSAFRLVRWLLCVQMYVCLTACMYVHLCLRLSVGYSKSGVLVKTTDMVPASSTLSLTRLSLCWRVDMIQLLDSGIFVPLLATGTAWSVDRCPLSSLYARDVHCLTADWMNHSQI